MAGEGYKSRIDKLRKSLYSRNRKDRSGSINKTRFRRKKFDVNSEWEDPNNEESLDRTDNEIKNQENLETDFQNLEFNPIMKKKKKSNINKILIGAFIFLILAFGFAFFSIMGNKNTISSDNIEIELSGPILVNAGDVLSFEIELTNKNNVNLETTDLIIGYPDGTRDPDNIKNTLKRYRKSLGKMEPGDQKKEVIEAVLFGEQGSVKEIIVGFEYRVSDSNAIFFIERKYEVEINTSPISLEVISQKEIGSGQEAEFILEIRSNSEIDLENVILEAEYPFGFSVLSSDPEAVNKDKIWKIPILKSGEKETIKLNGKIEGQDGENRVFRFNAGLEDEKIEDKLSIVFVSNSKSILIKRSFIGLDLSINGNSKVNQVAAGGEQIRVDLSWRNNLPVKIKNGVLEVILNGEIIDKSSITSGNGFYNSSKNTIFWDKRSNSELNIIEEGNFGTMSFNFSIKQPSSIIELDLKNPKINIEALFSGDRIDENTEKTESVTSSIKKDIKISSDTKLVSKIVHFEGDFINTGPLPPVVDSETTYTAVLSISNLVNDLSGGVIKAILPPYVRWMGLYLPASEEVSYNPIGGEFKWEVNDIYSGTGYTRPARELKFQIALKPSLSLVGKTPNLLEDIKFSGLDVFTDTKIEIENKDLNSRFRSDNRFQENMSTVVQ